MTFVGPLLGRLSVVTAYLAFAFVGAIVPASPANVFATPSATGAAPAQSASDLTISAQAQPTPAQPTSPATARARRTEKIRRRNPPA